MRNFFIVLLIILTFSLSGCLKVSSPKIVINESFQTEYAVGSNEPDWFDAATVTDKLDGESNISYENVDTQDLDMNKVGDYPVTIKVKNSSGKTSKKTLIIHIVKHLKPVITLNGDSNVTIYTGQTYEDKGAKAEDKLGNDLSSDIIVSGLNSLDINTPGDYIIKYQVSKDGIEADGQIRTVHVIDDLSQKIKNEQLETFIRNELGIPTGPITKEDALKLQSLDASHALIDKLDGIEYFTNLSHLDVSDNKITDLTPLKKLVDVGAFKENSLEFSQISLIGNEIDTTDPNTATILREIASKNIITDISVVDEDQNNMDHAKLISVNSKTDATIDFYQDQDWYTFTLDQDGPVSIYTTSDKVTTFFTISSETHSSYTSPISDSNNMARLNLNLTKGTYTIKVQTKRFWTKPLYLGAYTLHVEGPLHFNDSNLEQIIRNQINKPTGDLTPNDVAGIKSLEIGLPISDYTGIEQLTQLTSLSISGSQITNLDHIKNVTSLKELSIYNTPLADLSGISQLKELEFLDLDYNNISDISPLNGLKHLIRLSIYNNQISDISILQTLLNDGNFTSTGPLSNEIIMGHNSFDLNQNMELFKTILNKNISTDIKLQLYQMDFDYKANAKTLNLNETITDSFGIEKGKASYKFTLTKDSQITFTMSEFLYRDIIIYDENGNIKLSSSKDSYLRRDHTNLEGTLTSGTYYLVFSRYYLDDYNMFLQAE